MTVAMAILTAAIITAIFICIGIASVRIDRWTEWLADRYVLTCAPKADREDRQYAEMIAELAAVGTLIGGIVFAALAWMSTLLGLAFPYGLVALFLLQCGLWFIRVARGLRAMRVRE